MANERKMNVGGQLRLIHAGKPNHAPGGRRLSTGVLKERLVSIQAMAWAIEQQEVKDPVTRLVLICLSNYASADGTSAFPSINRLMNDTGLSERSVRRRLRQLEKMIMIRLGSKAVVAAKIKRTDRHPRAYDILIPRGAPQTPRTNSRGQTDRSGGSNGPLRGVQQTPDPSEGTIKDPVQDFVKDFTKRFGKEPKL
jgi:Helix-turn-helix domain